jgi:tetratricopeptide (TPR) repeat protein
MFEYRKTEKFDIGAGYGEYEYDFFMINGEEDFWTLMNHYSAVYRRFNYFLDGYKKTENNNTLSPFVKAMMKEHNANLCLTLLDAEYKEDYTATRKMVINIQKTNGIYETYFFNFYYCITVGAKDYLERGSTYKEAGGFEKAKADFAKALELNPGDEMAKECLEKINNVQAKG